MDIFNPSTFSQSTDADRLYSEDINSSYAIERSTGSSGTNFIGLDDSGAMLRLEFDRFRGPFVVKDYMTWSSKDLIKLANAMEIAKAAEAGNFVVNGPSGDHFMRGNNVVLKDWPEDKIHKNSRYRLTDAYGANWTGPLRTLGVLTHVRRPRLVGYVVSRRAEVSIPDLERQITYPLGSASVRLDKTHQDLRSVHRMMPVYASYDVMLDVSVSSMVESEGKFLRNAISPHHFSYDVLEAHRRANDLRGDFLASAIEGHNDIYLWGTTEFCIRNACYGVESLEEAGNLLSHLVGSYNYASMGVKYQYLSSKAFPDPIKVGNMGDVNGNMATPEPDFDLSGYASELFNGALGFLQTMYKSPSLGQIGLAKNDGKGATGPGWQVEPAPDGGMAWNVSHMQAAYHLDGQLLTPPAVDWFNEVRLIVVNDETSKKLQGCGTAGSGTLRLAHDFGTDYVFIPAIRYEPGHGDIIHQDGSVINLLIDRYNPEVDDAD